MTSNSALHRLATNDQIHQEAVIGEIRYAFDLRNPCTEGLGTLRATLFSKIHSADLIGQKDTDGMTSAGFVYRGFPGNMAAGGRWMIYQLVSGYWFRGPYQSLVDAMAAIDRLLPPRRGEVSGCPGL